MKWKKIIRCGSVTTPALSRSNNNSVSSTACVMSSSVSFSFGGRLIAGSASRLMALAASRLMALVASRLMALAASRLMALNFPPPPARASDPKGARSTAIPTCAGERKLISLSVVGVLCRKGWVSEIPNPQSSPSAQIS